MTACAGCTALRVQYRRWCSCLCTCRCSEPYSNRETSVLHSSAEVILGTAASSGGPEAGAPRKGGVAKLRRRWRGGGGEAIAASDDWGRLAGVAWSCWLHNLMSGLLTKVIDRGCFMSRHGRSLVPGAGCNECGRTRWSIGSIR